MHIAIVDCGMGNLHSVEAGLRRAGASAKIVDNAADIDSAQKVVLPGDGHFAACAREIDSRNLRAALLRAAASKPFLGICIGMQILYAGSDEAPDARGLSLLPGRVCKLPSAAGKIPHIGWNTTDLRPHPLWAGVQNQSYFYFIHSFYAPPDETTIAQTHYGATFAAAAAKGHILAAQFHPEKSGKNGATVLANFTAI